MRAAIVVIVLISGVAAGALAERTIFPTAVNFRAQTASVTAQENPAGMLLIGEVEAASDTEMLVRAYSPYADADVEYMLVQLGSYAKPAAGDRITFSVSRKEGPLTLYGEIRVHNL